MKTNTVIADTGKKGHRVYLEGLTNRVGHTYMVTFTDDSILVHFTPEGKRKVVARGVIDLQSKRVTQWARGATMATIHERDTGTIVIKRAAS